MKKIDKGKGKNFLLSLGFFFILSGVIGIFSEEKKLPIFHGRWGWLWEIIYNNFGDNGKYYIFILGGIFFIYYAVFKTNNINK
ncbi:MAG: hypothetical protein CTY29_07310 [Methylobacter sp.]|nr:MAG: hypothetical protein CTY29_07310 [Methylobacter sp.]